MKKQIGIISTALIMLLCLQASLYAEEVCEFTFNACPKDFNGDTIILSKQVVALSSSVMACSDSVQYPVSDSNPPPSIMFVIDNSLSMSGSSGITANDQDGARFTVTKEFIDSIYANQPKAEVGLVVFTSSLIFDSTTGQYYTKYFKTLPQVFDTLAPRQAYVKMLTLDSLYGGKKGIDILNDILATKDTTVRRRTYTDLVYQPTIQPLGTDINLAFYAAKDAMKRAVNPKERQFIIFFSDGEPNGTVLPDSVRSYNFRNGVDVPTTFTVYFTSGNTVPQSIQTMTTNIQNNKYSSSNPNSQSWAIRAEHDSLLNLLMSNAMKSIMVHGNPNHMVINGITSVGTTDSSFLFPKNFALIGTITPFSAVVKYQFKTPDNSLKEDSVNLKFVVKRTNSAPLPSGIGTNCWEQPTLQFYYNNNPISEATEDMQQLQIRLNPNEETVINPKVDIKSSLETITITLSSVNSGAYWGKSFTRATNATAIKDNILQHLSGDSIIAVYRNPDLPLDSIRVAIPVKVPPQPIPPIPVTATLRDTSADGHFDRIDLTWTDTTIDIIKSLPTFSEFISNAQITSADGVLKLNPGAVVKRTGDTVSIILIENTGKNLETGWTSADVKLTNVVMTVQGNAFTVEKIIDNAGPVLDRVLYYPGNGSQHDSLKVVFSEPVNCANLTNVPHNPELTFKYIDAGKQNQDILKDATFPSSACDSKSFITEVYILLQSNDLVIPGEDSMSLFGNSTYVVDNNNNRPPSNNRPIPIQWGTDNQIKLGVSSNPSIIGKTDIAPLIRQHYGIKETKGVVIGITSRMPFKQQEDGSYGSAIVYDAVGNLILEKIPIKKSESGNDYAINWNWKNRYNRVVGAGTYLFIISSSTTDRKVYTKKVKVGLING